FFYVANDVGQLKGEAQLFRKRFGSRIVIAKHSDAHQADDRSNTIAVEVKIIESSVMNREFSDTGTRWLGEFFLLEIHRGAIRQLIEQFARNCKAALRIGQGQQYGIIRGTASLRAMNCLQPLAQFLPPVA